jgi:hypothetical protein
MSILIFVDWVNVFIKSVIYVLRDWILCNCETKPVTLRLRSYKFVERPLQTKEESNVTTFNFVHLFKIDYDEDFTSAYNVI